MMVLDTHTHTVTEPQVFTRGQEKSQIRGEEAESKPFYKGETKASCGVCRNCYHDLEWYFCHLEEDSSVEPDALFVYHTARQLRSSSSSLEID